MEVFTDVRSRAMELITILNRRHRFRGFVYHGARFTSDQKRQIRARMRSAAICSRRHQPAPGNDQLPERGFGSSRCGDSSYFCTLCDASIAPLRRVVVAEVPQGDVVPKSETYMFLACCGAPFR